MMGWCMYICQISLLDRDKVSMTVSNLTNRQQSELDIPSHGKAATGQRFFFTKFERR